MHHLCLRLVTYSPPSPPFSSTAATTEKRHLRATEPYLSVTTSQHAPVPAWPLSCLLVCHCRALDTPARCSNTAVRHPPPHLATNKQPHGHSAWHTNSANQAVARAP